MRVFNYSAGADTGGGGWNVYQAFRKHSTWTYWQTARSSNYIRYPRAQSPSQVRRLWADADVCHIRNNYRGVVQLMPKPTVITYHGTSFRKHPKAYTDVQRSYGGLGIVSTLDLWLLAPKETTWVGPPHDLDWEASFRKPKDDGVLRIGHAPTDRTIKSTGAFLAAVQRLGKEFPVQLVMPERKTWTQALQSKGTVDVVYDQVILGYGNNAIEAWAMGIPVICGAQPDTLAEMRNRFEELPFYEATEKTIYEALREMIDPDLREKYGKRGRAHVEEFHSGAVVVPVLEGLYTQALG